MPIKQPGLRQVNVRRVGDSTGGGGSSGMTLAQAYALGLTDASQTLALTDTSNPGGGGLIIDGTGAGYTGASVLTIKVPGQTISVSRSSGFLTASNGFVFGTSTSSSTAVVTANTVRFAIDGTGVTEFIAQNPTVAAAAGATNDAVTFNSSTTTITGTTTISNPNGFNYLNISAPTYTSSSAVQVNGAATVYIGGAPIAAGLVTIVGGTALTVNGAASLNSNVFIGGSLTCNISAAIPEVVTQSIDNGSGGSITILTGAAAATVNPGGATNTKNLGSTAATWANVTAANFNASIGGTTSAVFSTSGLALSGTGTQAINKTGGSLFVETTDADDVVFLTNSTEVMRMLGSNHLMKFAAASIVANGAVATAMTSLGPTGSHATIQEWLTIQNSAGTQRWIPCF